MERSLQEVENIVRAQVCSVCSDRLDNGTCGLEKPSDCALFRSFPQVAEAIRSVKSDDIGDYIRAIREKVCSICSGQHADGSCTPRAEVRCALDAYAVLIVGALEEATGKTFGRPPEILPPQTIISLT